MRNMKRLAALAAAAAFAVAGSTAGSVAQEPLKIGFSMALTGGLAGAGKAALVGMEIWRDDTNEAGGLLGRPVELVYYDDQTNPSTVPGIYSKLIDDDQVDLVVSGYGTNLIAPAMPIVMRKQMAFITLFGLDANAQFNYDRYFQIMPAGAPDPAKNWAQGFIDLMLEHDLKTIAIVGADAEFSKNAMKGAREDAEAAGLEIVYDQTYKPDTTDYTPIVRAIQATNPDAVYVGSYPPDTVGMIRAANELDLQTKLFGGGMVGAQYASIQQSLGSMMNGIVNYDFWVPEPTLDFPGIEEFLAKYQERAAASGDVDPLGHYLPPFAYAYLQVLGQAVEGVGEIDQEKIAAYMRDNEFETVVGTVKFGERGEWATPRVLQVQFQNVEDNNLDQFRTAGKRVVIKPDEWASGELIFPYTAAKE
jgi:branched-chain amino acid transport system substrate-binding protein